METTASVRITASARLLAAFAAVREMDLPASADAARTAALDVADIVRTLDADDDVVIAAMLMPLLDGTYLDPETAEKRLRFRTARLARALGQLGHFGLPPDWTPERGLEGRPGRGAAQDCCWRSSAMCVLVVVRLAEQLQEDALRQISGTRQLSGNSPSKRARYTRRWQIAWAFWQVKWELEDMAFRYLEPIQYKHIAAALKVRRSERERYMDELKAQLLGRVAAGRHRRHDRGAPEAYLQHLAQDAGKAVGLRTTHGHPRGARAGEYRAECYAALGVVHSLWQFIPG